MKRALLQWPQSTSAWTKNQSSPRPLQERSTSLTLRRKRDVSTMILCSCSQMKIRRICATICSQSRTIQQEATSSSSVLASVSLMSSCTKAGTMNLFTDWRLLVNISVIVKLSGTVSSLQMSRRWCRAAPIILFVSGTPSHRKLWKYWTAIQISLLAVSGSTRTLLSPEVGTARSCSGTSEPTTCHYLQN